MSQTGRTLLQGLYYKDFISENFLFKELLWRLFFRLQNTVD